MLVTVPMMTIAVGTSENQRSIRKNTRSRGKEKAMTMMMKGDIKNGTDDTDRDLVAEVQAVNGVIVNTVDETIEAMIQEVKTAMATTAVIGIVIEGVDARNDVRITIMMIAMIEKCLLEDLVIRTAIMTVGKKML
jgi:hypothetical protein